MTPAQIKKTTLYRTLAPCVRKEDREELARMLAMAGEGQSVPMGYDELKLINAFAWAESAQGYSYWNELSYRLRHAGHECW